jgi:hypothetical protein
MLLRCDGVLDIEVRIALETDDKQCFTCTERVYGTVPHLNRGEAIDPSSYYFRTTRYFGNRFGKLFLAQSHLFDCYGSRVGDCRGFDFYQVL